jgi:hypothetical protein
VSCALPAATQGSTTHHALLRNGQSLSFYPHVPTILLHLSRSSIPICAASRTSAPNAARQALNGLYLHDPAPTAQDQPGHSPRRGDKSNERLVKAISECAAVLAVRELTGAAAGLFDYMEVSRWREMLQDLELTLNSLADLPWLEDHALQAPCRRHRCRIRRYVRLTAVLIA